MQAQRLREGAPLGEQAKVVDPELLLLHPCTESEGSSWTRGRRWRREAGGAAPSRETLPQAARRATARRTSQVTAVTIAGSLMGRPRTRSISSASEERFARMHLSSGTEMSTSPCMQSCVAKTPRPYGPSSSSTAAVAPAFLSISLKILASALCAPPRKAKFPALDPHGAFLLSKECARRPGRDPKQEWDECNGDAVTVTACSTKSLSDQAPLEEGDKRDALVASRHDVLIRGRLFRRRRVDGGGGHREDELDRTSPQEHECRPLRSTKTVSTSARAVKILAGRRLAGRRTAVQVKFWEWLQAPTGIGRQIPAREPFGSVW